MKHELMRLRKACGYSMQGLRAAWYDAGAFRTEILATPVIVIAAFYFANNGTERALLIGSWLSVIIVELLNTGIEAVTDLAAKGEILPLAEKAKDVASAAVLVAAFMCLIVWVCILTA